MVGCSRPCLVCLRLEVRFRLTGQSYSYAIYDRVLSRRM